MGTILLHQIAFEGSHGVTRAERARTRRFEVDLELQVDTASAERSDDLADTVDYSALAEIVVRIGTGEPHHLLESLARRMMEAVRAAHPRATSLCIEVRKMQPPGCPGHPAYSAVRLRSP